MSGLETIYRCNPCRRLRDTDRREACAANGDACGFMTGDVEALNPSPHLIKQMWRQDNPSMVRGVTWGIVGVSLVLIIVAVMRAAGG